MPIMLCWKLWQAGALTNSEIGMWYFKMLKPAAEFLANGGTISDAQITALRDTYVGAMEHFANQGLPDNRIGLLIFIRKDLVRSAIRQTFG